MAKKVAAATGTALAHNTPSGLPAEWERELAESANAAATAEKSVGSSSVISHKGSHFSYQGAILEQPMQTVVLDSRAVNAFYEGEFDSENPESPVCFAIGNDPDALVPHDDAPKKQHHECATCPQNAFGSGKGRGKACKNMRRLIVIAHTPEGVTEQDTPAVLNIPPTSLKHWAGYVKAKLKGQLQRPPWSVVTNWVTEPSGGAYVVIPSLGATINDVAQLSVIKKLAAGVQDDIERPFQPRDPAAATTSKGGKRRVAVADVKKKQQIAPPAAATKVATKRGKF